MPLLGTLRRSGGLDALARKLDVQPPVAALGATALVPLVVGGYRRYLERKGGTECGLRALLTLLAAEGGGALAMEIMTPRQADETKGWRLLEAVFGPKVPVDKLVLQAARESGLAEEMIRRLLPLLAMLVGGYLAARAEGAEMDGGRLQDELVDLLELDVQPNPLDLLGR